MQEMQNLLKIIEKLRAPDGCPWDKIQTHDSIRGHLLEEAAEFLDAVDAKNYPNMCEELGDLLMHILLHSQMAKEQGNFDFSDVVKELSSKLVRRHPHVFGQAKVNNADDVVKIWSDVKSTEKKSRPKSENFWENLPRELSALRKARDAAKHLSDETLSQIEGEPQSDEMRCGKELFDAVKKCRALGVEPEGALRDYLVFLRKKTDAEFAKSLEKKSAKTRDDCAK
ncbi:MAG: MazG family protein [Opitutales bacterium]|nr:MazG family protein [Opitutales bacterium]